MTSLTDHPVAALYNVEGGMRINSKRSKSGHSNRLSKRSRNYGAQEVEEQHTPTKDLEQMIDRVISPEKVWNLPSLITHLLSSPTEHILTYSKEPTAEEFVSRLC